MSLNSARLLMLLAIALLMTVTSAQANPITWCFQNPVKCKEIADKIKQVLESQEWKCSVVLTGECNKGHASTKFNRVCNDVKQKVRSFSESPTDAGFQSILDATGSSRAACVAQRTMGCDQWKGMLENFNLKNDFRYKCSNW